MNPRLLVFALALATCRGAALAPPAGPPPPAREVSFTVDPEFHGLKFTLREATPPDRGVSRPPVAPSTPLAEAVVEDLFARTDPLVEQLEDRQAFALRPASEPPPLTGATVEVPFPPPATPADRPAPPPAGPLHVTRHAPEGELEVVPHVTVSFDQPMVSVTSQEEAAKNLPVKLDPQPPGKWRWLGTQTLQFDPDTRTGEPVGRMAASTAYTVTIPAGTTSATGGILAAEERFTFATPTVRVQRIAPESGPHDLDPVIALELDQEVDPAAVLAHARLEGGGQAFPLRLATDAEVEADPIARNWKKSSKKGRFVALHATRHLPRATSFSLVVTGGLRSLEGPRTTSGDVHYGFFTYAPLEVDRAECAYGGVCRPDMGWTVFLNNPLEPKVFDPSTIRIDPAFEAVIAPSGSAIHIQGRKDGRKTYAVTLPAGLTDAFGQTLGSDKTVRFDVGPAERTLYGPGSPMIVVDPGQKPQFPVWSLNHRALKVEVRRVTGGDWPAWQRFLRKLQYDDATPSARPGVPLRTETVKITTDPDHLVETDLDLSPYLEEGHGQFVVWVEPSVQPANRWERQYAYAWVQVTDLGVTAFVDADQAIVWAASLTSGDPVEGVKIEMGLGESGTTGADGLGAVPLPPSMTVDSDGYVEQQVLVARKGSDLAILPEQTGWWGGGSWVKQSELDQLRWYVFDDRGMYRPGENVRVKGWIRRFESRTHGDLQALGDSAPTAIHWRLFSSVGNPMGEGDVAISALGGFDVAFDLPETPNLGTARLMLTAEGSGLAFATTSHPIEIQEFRRPEFEVTATSPPGTWTLGEEATFEVAAAYYAGGGLPSAEVRWNVWATPAAYTPPGREGYVFGRWIPWWDPSFSYDARDRRRDQALQGKTDATGKHYVAAHFESVTPPRAMTVTAQASVMDVNRQQWTSSSTLLVHPSAVYVGLKTGRPFVQKGDDIAVDVIAVDPDGGSRITEVKVHAARIVPAFEGGTWTEAEKEPQDCTVSASADVGQCKFKAENGGQVRIRATAMDALGRATETEITVWVAGGDAAPNRGLARERVLLIPEKQEYQPGETARFLVQSPFVPAEGILTIARSGVVRQERFRMDAATATLEVPILEEHIPGFTVQVDLVGLQVRLDDHGKPLADPAKRTAYATGSLTYSVPPLARTLAVEVHPGASKLAPGGKTRVEVSVKDAAGRPVADAELVVVAADESVLALSGYKLPDPLEVFYAARPGGVRTTDLRQSVQLANPVTVTAALGDSMDDLGGLGGLGARASGFGGGGRGEGGEVDAPMGAPAAEAPPEEESRSRSAADEKNAGAVGGNIRQKNAPTTPIAVRTHFDALALFAPEVRTGADGTASVALALPDSLTRYRIMVVAVSGGKAFGKAESNVTAQLPLMVRPSPPRFLNFGDQFELPIVLQNQTDAPLTVDVGVRATNIDLAGASAATAPFTQAGRQVTVPANDRVEVRFPASTSMAGTARFQAVASSGALSDAARFELPVWTPATTEAFATYGTTADRAVVQPVAAPGEVWPQFGGLQVQTSSTQLQALTDAVLYLQRYPYDCNEQIASRMMGIAALRDVLTAFESPDLPSPTALEAQVDHDLRRLRDRQNSDGGFAFWRRGDESWPFLGIYVAHGYAEAKAKRYEVPTDAWSRSASYLRNIRNHIPSWYSFEEKAYLRAYALYVRWRMGDTDGAGAKALLREAGDQRLSLEAHGYLLPVFHAAKENAIVAQQLQYLANHGTETAGAMAFGDTYEHGEHVLLASNRRADGVILRGLLVVDPMNDMVPKIVKGLLGHRKKGHWSNTQEDTFILLALDTYFAIYEKETPDFVARVWLGDGYVGEHAFRGRTTERALSEVPMGYLTETKGPQNLVIDKQGAGRLYYRIGMTYAPKDLNLEPADYGFYVKRTYEAVDDPQDVTRDGDGTWRIRAGKQVRVRLVMVAQARRYHVALVDPLPAGLEAENPALATTGVLPSDPSAVSNQPWWYWWTRTWYEHENLRDERVEAFTSLLWDGAWEYTYLARATTPGTFVVPPAKAEEMYSPETFGRTGTDRVVVE